MKCSVRGCETDLELDLSFLLKICRWCRLEFHPEWDDEEWFNQWEDTMENRE